MGNTKRNMWEYLYQQSCIEETGCSHQENESDLFSLTVYPRDHVKCIKDLTVGSEIGTPGKKAKVKTFWHRSCQCFSGTWQLSQHFRQRHRYTDFPVQCPFFLTKNSEWTVPLLTKNGCFYHGFLWEMFIIFFPGSG